MGYSHLPQRGACGANLIQIIGSDIQAMKKIIILAAIVATIPSVAQVCVFDSMTNAVITDTGGLPRAMKGMAYSLGNQGAGNTTIVGMDFDLVNVSGTNVVATNVEVDVSFWDIANNTTSGTGAAFNNRLATYNITLGPGTYNSGFFYNFGSTTSNAGPPAVTFTTPFTFSGATNLGVQILVKVDDGTGTGLVAQNNLDPAVCTTNPPTIGAYTANPSTVFGFYRNASQPNATLTNPDTSLLGSDFRTFANTTNIGLPIRLYSTPEPTTMMALCAGIVALVARR